MACSALRRPTARARHRTDLGPVRPGGQPSRIISAVSPSAHFRAVPRPRGTRRAADRPPQESEMAKEASGCWREPAGCPSPCARPMKWMPLGKRNVARFLSGDDEDGERVRRRRKSPTNWSRVTKRGRAASKPRTPTQHCCMPFGEQAARPPHHKRARWCLRVAAPPALVTRLPVLGDFRLLPPFRRLHHQPERKAGHVSPSDAASTSSACARGSGSQPVPSAAARPPWHLGFLGGRQAARRVRPWLANAARMCGLVIRPR